LRACEAYPLVVMPAGPTLDEIGCPGLSGRHTGACFG